MKRHKQGRQPHLKRWRAEMDAMFDRMQSSAFEEAVLELLDNPIRVPIPAHLKKRPAGNDDPART